MLSNMLPEFSGLAMQKKAFQWVKPENVSRTDRRKSGKFPHCPPAAARSQSRRSPAFVICKEERLLYTFFYGTGTELQPGRIQL